VLVVGFGNSGGEIALDLWEHGASAVEIAVRGPVNILPRDLFGLPLEAIAMAEQILPPRIADALNAPIVRLCMGDLRRYGLRQAADGPISQIRTRGRIPVIDVGTVQLIKMGAVPVRPGVSEFRGAGGRLQ
jgi:cation diffusion facilitator CzcD-associated flavoprotein CzcO